MDITGLCPECGLIAYPVPVEVVQNFTSVVEDANKNERWHACINRTCTVAYFTEGFLVRRNNCRHPLWYKDSGENVPVCYCSKLTRGEIKMAVRAGCRTIDEVQQTAGKNITGNCRSENPLGECCRNVFLKTMNDTIAELAQEQPNNKKLRILFLCTGNSCRSQMAEGWTRQLKGDSIEVYSAGIETHGLNQFAVKVMAEVGVDISHHRSKNIVEVKHLPFDWVITVCDAANESCPLFPGQVKRFHVSFDDPPKLAKNAATEEEALAHYRRVRDEIREFVDKLPDVLNNQYVQRSIEKYG
jgi:arsenate reductase (thioredoxin)